MGEQLCGLSVKELKGLENQLEMSLQGIRLTKVSSKDLITLCMLLFPSFLYKILGM